MSKIKILKDVEVGKFYKVPCVRDTHGRYVPVIPFLHADKQFGTSTASLLHFHVDTRFFNEQLDLVYDVERGKTLRVFAPLSDNEKQIFYRRLKCRRTEFGMTGLPYNTKVKNIIMNKMTADWYEAQIGKSCKGRFCPHYGAEMLENENGLLECKLHGLLADKKTLKVVGNVHQGVIKK